MQGRGRYSPCLGRGGSITSIWLFLSAAPGFGDARPFVSVLLILLTCIDSDMQVLFFGFYAHSIPDTGKQPKWVRGLGTRWPRCTHSISPHARPSFISPYLSLCLACRSQGGRRQGGEQSQPAVHAVTVRLDSRRVCVSASATVNLGTLFVVVSLDSRWMPPGRQARAIEFAPAM